MSLIHKSYVVKQITCWKCGKKTNVYTWPGHEVWETRQPPLPKPESLQWRFSQMIEGHYWANTCEKCGMIQGDWFLYEEPDGPFFPLS